MDGNYSDQHDVVDVRLKHLAGMAFSGHQIGTWCFSAQTQKLYFTTVMHEEYLKVFFEKSSCKDFAFRFDRNIQSPFLMSDQYGLVWLGEYATLDVGARMLIVMGPVFYGNTSLNHIRTIVEKMELENMILMHEKSSYSMVLQSIPVVSAQTMVSYARILHFTITGQTLPLSEIYYQTEAVVSLQTETLEDENERSWWDYSHIYNQEQLFLQCVRDGNLNYKEIIDGLNHTVMDIALSENPVSSERYKVIANAALSTRAAIEGGLSPKTAIALEKEYLDKADKMTKVTELRELNIQMLDDLIQRVHTAKKTTGLSRHIQECCDYISSHLTGELTTKKIAKEVGYTEYYLTRKFQKEMGLRLIDYIKEARLEYAKVCLVSTEMSVEEISDLLQFNSRNHFTRVFREKIGMTPTEYRTRKTQE